MKIVPVILLGGSEARLWLLPRKQYPKQYLPLEGDNTILRLNGLDSIERDATKTYNWNIQSILNGKL
jgi:mannose-1-phosphate guanylyltransferase